MDRLWLEAYAEENDVGLMFADGLDDAIIGLARRKGSDECVAYDYDKCIDCGSCASLCPSDALSLNSEWRLEYDEEKCISCFLCLDSCPRYAIEEN